MNDLPVLDFLTFSFLMAGKARHHTTVMYAIDYNVGLMFGNKFLWGWKFNWTVREFQNIFFLFIINIYYIQFIIYIMFKCNYSTR